MSRRPRLVHEGSPILDDDDSIDEEPSANSPFSTSQNWNKSKKASYSNGRKESAPKFKLQTRLVIGGETVAAPTNLRQQQFDDDDSLDAMMTDDADIDETQSQRHHHQQHNNGMYSNTQQAYSQQNEHQSFYEPQPPSQLHHMPPSTAAPLVVIDGANISYNYAESLNPSLSSQHVKREPNPKGITIAVQYFLQHSCRVQAVVPISWYRLKPRPGDHACAGGYKGNLNQRDDAKMVTEEVEELRWLRQNGFLVACPPGDDDDAYAIALARREEERLVGKSNYMQDDGMMMDDENTCCLPMGGYILSNDFYQDAIKRDQRQQKQHFHEHQYQQTEMSSLSQQSSKMHSLKAWLKHHRISYSFANVGLTAADGEVELDFLPNPRNELIEAIDAHFRLNQH